MKTFHASQSHRRPGARRLATAQRKAGHLPAARHCGACHQGGAISADAPLNRTSTGLLIPRLSPAVPKVYEGEVPHAAARLRELVECGALKPEFEADSIEGLLHHGITNLVPDALLAYEDQFGEWVTLHVGPEGIDFGVWQDCHAWKMRLKPIIEALNWVDGCRFVKALNRSRVQGPFFWSEIVCFGYSDDDDKDWLKKLEAKHPPLEEREAPQSEEMTLQLIFAGTPPPKCPPRDTPPELRRYVARFIETAGAVERIAGEGALMVTTWDKNCPIDHAHDYLHEAIHNDGWDNQDGCAFDFRGTVEEVAAGLELAGNFVEAAQALEEWSNANC